MKESLEQQAKTKYTIQNKPGDVLLTAHEYVLEKYMAKLLAKRTGVPIKA